MRVHTYNNNVIVNDDKDARILKMAKPGEGVSMETIVCCLGISRTQARHHVRRLLDSGVLVMSRFGRQRVYMRGAGNAPSRRDSCIEFAGPRSFGRGLANW